MPGEKTEAVVLKVRDYRETSALVYLFSRRHGLVHCVAKGVKGRRRDPVSLERGIVIEGVVYVKPNRDLHTLGAVAVVDFFPRTRSDLVKSAVRDAALELALGTIPQSDPHRELYTLFGDMLRAIEGASSAGAATAELWRFYLGYAGLLGFGPNFSSCCACGQELATDTGGVLVYRRGGMLCGRCAPASGPLHVPGRVTAFLNGSQPPPDLSGPEMLRISRLLAAYCAYHFDAPAEFRSLDFLASLPAEAARSSTLSA